LPNSTYTVLVKGAPEKLWSLSSYYMLNGKSEPINDEITKNFEKANLSFGKNGERVLGFA